jgi:hypothetical protein
MLFTIHCQNVYRIVDSNHLLLDGISALEIIQLEQLMRAMQIPHPTVAMRHALKAKLNMDSFCHCINTLVPPASARSFESALLKEVMITN